MESKRLYALIVLILVTESVGLAIESIDTLNPIIRRSPARDTRDDDLFGFSFAIHQMFSDPSGLTGDDALSQTVVMIGAPKGEFPGGLSGLTPSGLACRPNFTLSDGQLFLDDDFLRALDPEDVWPCYRGRQWGLVYQCSLHEDECIAPLGNGDRESYDGLLFDSVGNLQTRNTISGSDGVYQFKDTQLMGYSLHSSGDYFVACAPGWEQARFDIQRESQPRGRCVYSNRTLEGFRLLLPCVGSGSSGNQGNGGQCTSGVGNIATKTNIWISSVGFELSRGLVSQYTGDLNNPDTREQDFSEVYVVPHNSLFDDPHANFDVIGSYYGYHLTYGAMTAIDSEDLISSSVRFPEIGQAGRVSIVTNIIQTPTMFVDGEQFGEYFGLSVAAVDLNGDGFDDLVVGAPIYGIMGKAEIGRIYVYRNNNGASLERSIVIPGQAIKGRFGYSIAALGDLNNDGYEDFAVSAPYEGSGVVYIYHGQEMDSEGSIVDTEYKQRIVGEDFLSGASLFGFTIEALVDIDLNEYRDLVVGTPDSQAVVVLRTRPVARINTTLTPSVEEIFLDNPTCFNTMNDPVPCFTVRVCAEYTGRGVGTFSAQYRASEFGSNRRRLFFIDNNEEVTSYSGTLMFSGEGVSACDNLTVYVLDTSGRNIDDFVVQLEFEQLDINSANSLSTPVLDFRVATVNVGVAAECGLDDICTSDLFINVESITYISNSMDQNVTALVANSIDTIRVSIEYGNLFEQAITANITFTLPPLIQHTEVLPRSLGVICDRNATDTETFYTCDVTFSANAPSSNLQLQWRPSQSIRGDEEDLDIPISITIQEQSRNTENAINITNNVDSMTIPIAAKAVYNTEAQFTLDFLEYDSTNRPDVNNQSSNLGDSLGITVSVQNNGPSIIYNSTINIYIPASAEETGEYYYYYPASFSLTQPDATVTTVMCDASVLNPGNLVTGSSKRRRKRSEGSGYPNFSDGLSRMTRQDTEEFTLDCQNNRDSCILFTCTVTDFIPGTITLSINGNLDGRFFYLKSDDYTLRAFASMEVLNPFIDTTGSTPDGATTVTISEQFVGGGSSDLGLALAIVLPTVGSIIFIVILAVALYCFGFFRRKKHGQEDTNEEFEAFDENAFTAKAAAQKEKESTAL